jgi:biopolymer transport protein ExbD
MARRHKGDPPGDVVLAITPMLDLTFQLLFFFIVIYHPSALEGQMDMALPAHSENKAEKPEDVLKPNESNQPELPADLTILLKTQNGGEQTGLITQIIVRDRAGDTNIPVDDKFEALEKYLGKAKEGLTNKEDIKIEGDSRLKWFYIVKVMDVCRKAGFKIGFGPPPDMG